MSETETTEIEFTDRYGGRHVNWLTACHGPCEALGCYPEYRGPKNADGTIPLGSSTDTDWVFTKCPDCNGTGRIGALRAVLRVPRWIWKGIRFVRESWNYPGPMTDQPRLNYLKMQLWSTWGADLGFKNPRVKGHM